jgi:hypothetical protein
MITFVRNSQDPLMNYIKDDPVRPEISKEFRVAANRFVSVLADDSVKAVLCVNLLGHVPKEPDELGDCEDPSVAVFYTIWSYAPGSAAKLLIQTVDQIKKEYPNIRRFVTLSPKTEMARRFHLKNGATIFSDNPGSVNYEYRF